MSLCRGYASSARVALGVAASNRRDMNETAAPQCPHLPAENLGAEEVAGQVDGQYRVPFGKRQVFEPSGPQHRRSVDEDAARSQRFLDHPRRSSNALGARGIAACHDMVTAQFTQLRARRLQAVLVAIDGGDMGTGPGET